MSKYCNASGCYNRVADSVTYCDIHKNTGALVLPNSDNRVSAVSANASSTVNQFMNQARQTGSSSGECLIIQGNSSGGTYEKFVFNNDNVYYERRNLNK
jgi:hypothetical protein